MARIRIDDLPLLEELGQEELQGIYGEGLFPGERLRLMAAAATLGISLASAPFATAGGPGKGHGGGGGGSGHSQGFTRTVQTTRGIQINQFRQSNQHSGYAQSGWHGDNRGGGQQHSQHVASFCKEHGTKFSHGFFYVGRNQKHFTERWYDARYATYLYFDPYAQCPYYWCEAHGVFYPIEYIETVGPDAKGPGPVVGGARGGAPVGGAPLGGGPAGGGAPVGGAAGGAPAGGGAPVGDGSAAGPVNGAPVGGAGGAPVTGAPAGGAAGGAGAPKSGAPAGGGAPAGDDSAAGSEEGPDDGAAAGGAAPGAPSGGAGATGAAPAKPVGAVSGVSVAKNRTAVAKKELQQVPAGTFDDAIPEEPK